MSQIYINPVHFVSALGIILIYLLTDVPDNFLIFLTNFLILVMSCLGMVSNKDQPYSLTTMNYIFVFFFFGFIPLNDLSNGNIYWGAAKSVNEFYQIITNILIVIGILAFWIGSMVKVRFFKFLPKVFSPKISLKKFWIIVFFSVVAFIILFVHSFNIHSLFFRGSVSGDVNNIFSSLSEIEIQFFKNFIRPLPFVILVIYVYIYKLYKFAPSKAGKNRYFTLSAAFLLLLFIFSVFLVSPTSVPRFWVATLYIPLLIIFTSFWNKPYRMQATILGSLIIIMPLLDKYRFDSIHFNWSLDFNFLNHGHYDAYQNFSRLVEIDLVTYGSQLVGTLLFFVPRFFWEGKPVSSGAALAQAANYDYSNISMPLIAEGFINFGVIGVVIFMFIFGLILRNFDRVAWQIIKTGKQSLFVYYYYFLFGLVFFNMRGDLMSSFAYTLGLTASFLFAVYILRILNYKLRFAL